MNEQMQEAAKLLLSTLTETKEFVLAQAPEIMQQMITWQITKGAMSAGLFLVLLISFLILLVKGIRAKEAPGETYSIVTTVLGVFVACTLIPLLVNGILAIQAIVAPKLFLLEQITRLL